MSWPQTEPNSSARAPHPVWTYLARAGWLAVQVPLWQLAWKPIEGMRGGILKLFGCSAPFMVLVLEEVRVYFPWSWPAARRA